MVQRIFNTITGIMAAVCLLAFFHQAFTPNFKTETTNNRVFFGLLFMALAYIVLFLISWPKEARKRSF